MSDTNMERLEHYIKTQTSDTKSRHIVTLQGAPGSAEHKNNQAQLLKLMGAKHVKSLDGQSVYLTITDRETLLKAAQQGLIKHIIPDEKYGH